MAKCPISHAQTEKLSGQKNKRTPGPYALFVQSKKSLYKGDMAEFAQRCACEWRHLSPVLKEKFQKRAKELRAKSAKRTSNPAYLKFVNDTYQCLRKRHPDWTSKRIREQLMKNYQKLKCKCNKKH
ncbi:unnamed protein product [Calicophoron daubneyi]|uniref:HMG box domain-containing protein n=1 Tax=Calicophoron daubneyi TaxID=300641 RepID=A0AAV2TTB7_CALDB